jgi:hypothetical protein
MGKMKALILLILLFVIAFSIIIFKISTKNICLSDSECEWKITNCCTEDSGAKWECVNVKSFNLTCPKFVICPKILSLKPNLFCGCEKGRCVVR